ncbi:hypothetical protein BLNAU_3017 [Blattamonas nauphoetae]|uniref:Uncharacterized protein n=1 Tax=Blattamonas nauphoetae TaxID=2049346 RepID=A0ABQ9YDX1_9EUKA|nr:hypothetical protein BLNAU_3017 [Blattamonas nauphoetae]
MNMASSDEKSIHCRLVPTFSDCEVEWGEGSIEGTPILFDEKMKDFLNKAGIEPITTLNSTLSSTTTNSFSPPSISVLELRGMSADFIHSPRSSSNGMSVYLDGSNGWDNTNCWLFGNQPCKSINYCLGKVYDTDVQLQLNGQFSESTITINRNSVELVGVYSTLAAICPRSYDCLFSVLRGSLSLHNIRLQPNHTTTFVKGTDNVILSRLELTQGQYSSSPFFASICSMMASNFDVIQLSMSDNVVFETHSSDLQLTTMNFREVASNQEGSVIRAKQAGCITLQNVNFHSCGCGPSFHGRSIFIDRQSGGSGEISFSSVFFIGSSTGLSEVYIISNNLNSIVSQSWSSIIPPISDSMTGTLNDFWGDDSSGAEPSITGPLVFLVYPRTTEVVQVSSSSVDNPNCGSSEAPCGTLASLSEIMHSTIPANEVVILSDIDHTMPLRLPTMPITVKPKETCQVTIDGGSFISPTHASTAFVSLTFNIISMTETLFSVEGGIVQFTACSFQTPQDNLYHMFAVVDSGSLQFLQGTQIPIGKRECPVIHLFAGNLLFNNAQEISDESIFNSEALFKLDGGQTEMIGQVISNVDVNIGHIFLVNNADSLILKNSQISGISSQELGVVISSNNCQFIVLNSVTIEFSDTPIDTPGRSIYVYADDFQETSIEMKDVNFISTPTFSDDTVAELYLEGMNLASVMIKENWAGTYQVEKENLLWGFDFTTGVNSTLLIYLVDIGTSVQIGGEQYFDVDQCGHYGLGCQTLSTAYDRIKHHSASLTLDIIDDIFDTDTVEFDQDQDIVLTGENAENIPSLYSTYVVLKSGSLSVFTLQLSLGYIMTPFFEIRGGIFSLDTSCTICPTMPSIFFGVISVTGGSALIPGLENTYGSLDLDSVSLLEQKGGELNLHDGTISNIHSTGKGSVLSSRLSQPDDKLDILRFSFKDCSTQNGDGGVLWVSCGENVDQSNVQISATFLECSCDSDSKGDWVFLEGHDFSKLISPALWLETIDELKNEVDDSKLWGLDTSEDHSSKYSSTTLLPYLIPHFANTITVGESGKNACGCGTATWICQTLSEAHRHLIDDDRTLRIHTKTALSIPLSFSPADLTIKPISGTAIVVVSGSGQFVNPSAPNGNTITFTKISFDVSGLTEHTMIVSRIGEIVLDHCSLTNTVSLFVPLLEASNGEVEVTKLSLLSLTIHKTPFIFSDLSSMTFKEVSVTDCTMSTFIQATNEHSTLSTAHIDGCSFEGPIASTTRNEESVLPTCQWESGLLHLTNISTKLNSSHFTHLSQGAVWMSGGRLTIEAGVFHDNGQTVTSFESFRQNINCRSGGVVDVESLVTGDGVSSSSGWISTDDCSVVSTVLDPLAPFFVPTLDTNKSSFTFDKKSKLISLTLKGEVYIPCGLSLEVSGSSSTNLDKNWTIVLSSSTCSPLSEKSIDLTLNYTTLSEYLNPKDEWSVCVVYGDKQRTDSFILKERNSAMNQGPGQPAMLWIIPVVVGVVVLLLILLILVCLCRRHQKKKGEDSEQLKENEELDPVG